jgi:hypothetical protein
MKTTQFTLETTANILIRCALIGWGILIFWIIMILAGGGWIFDFHHQFFDITRHEFDVIMYCGMGLLKLFVFFCFLMPYIAIRMVLGRESSSNGDQS